MLPSGNTKVKVGFGSNARVHRPSEPGLECGGQWKLRLRNLIVRADLQERTSGEKIRARGLETSLVVVVKVAPQSLVNDGTAMIVRTAFQCETCDQVHNQLRNASHHGSMSFDKDTQTISYRAGKGGTGQENQLPYLKYLSRCVVMFLQIVTLLRVEIMVCHSTDRRFPI